MRSGALSGLMLALSLGVHLSHSAACSHVQNSPSATGRLRQCTRLRDFAIAPVGVHPRVRSQEVRDDQGGVTNWPTSAPTLQNANAQLTLSCGMRSSLKAVGKGRCRG